MIEETAVMLMARFLPCLLLLVLAAPVHAQPTVKVPIGKAQTLDILVRVPAPAARCLVVSDPHKLLAVGHHAKHTAAHVSLFRLDAVGKVQGESVAIKLPRPAALVRLLNQPTGLAFHPTRPLLYVWPSSCNRGRTTQAPSIRWFVT